MNHLRALQPRLTETLAVVPSTAGFSYLITMKRFLISFLIGSLLSIITSLFLQPRDDDSSIITEWKQLARKPCNRTWHTKLCGSK